MKLSEKICVTTEPATLLLAGVGLAGVAAVAARRRGCSP
ncbi:MAG: PEP-CTERM sorting domain-containing protein [Planctomycetota bacterium]